MVAHVCRIKESKYRLLKIHFGFLKGKTKRLNLEMILLEGSHVPALLSLLSAAAGRPLGRHVRADLYICLNSFRFFFIFPLLRNDGPVKTLPRLS